MQWLNIKLVGLLSPLPDWVWYLLLSAFGVLLLLLLGIFIYRLWYGAELTTKWFSLKGIGKARQLEEKLEQTKKKAKEALHGTKDEFDHICRIGGQRRILLEGTRDILVDMAAMIDGKLTVTPDQFVTRLYRLSLKALLSVIHDDETNPRRVGLFVPDPEDPASLCLLDSCSEGFSTLEVQSKRLSLSGTAAGFVYTTGKEYINLHLSVNRDAIFKPREDGTFPYESLACVPVVVGHQVRGALSVDAQNPAAFSEEDIWYLHHTAAVIALGLTVAQHRDNFSEVAAGHGTGRNAHGIRRKKRGQRTFRQSHRPPDQDPPD